MKTHLSVLKLWEELQWYHECQDLRADGMTEEELRGYMEMYFDKFFTFIPIQLGQTNVTRDNRTNTKHLS